MLEWIKRLFGERKETVYDPTVPWTFLRYSQTAWVVSPTVLNSVPWLLSNTTKYGEVLGDNGYRGFIIVRHDGRLCVEAAIHASVWNGLSDQVVMGDLTLDKSRFMVLPDHPFSRYAYLTTVEFRTLVPNAMWMSVTPDNTSRLKFVHDDGFGQNVLLHNDRSGQSQFPSYLLDKGRWMAMLDIAIGDGVTLKMRVSKESYAALSDPFYFGDLRIDKRDVETHGQIRYVRMTAEQASLKFDFPDPVRFRVLSEALLEAPPWYAS